MLFLKIFLYGILFLFPVVLLARDRIDKDFPNQSRKYKAVTHIIILVYFLFLIPSSCILYNDLKDQSAQQKQIDNLTLGNNRLLSENIKLRSRLESLRNKIIEVYKKLSDKSQEIADLNRSLSAKSDKIADLNRDIAGFVSGGDSYCSVMISMPDSENRIKIFAEHKGKYPVYDVVIEILDLEKSAANFHKLGEEGIFRALADGTIEAYQDKKILTLGTVGPHQIAQLGVIKLSDRDKQTFDITVTARNGFYKKIYQYRRVGGNWIRAIMLTRNGKKSEEADPDFPRDDKGEIQWQ